VSKKITPGMDKLIGEADRIAKGDPKMRNAANRSHQRGGLEPPARDRRAT